MENKLSEPMFIRCPECGMPTDSMKCYTLPHVFLFLFIFASWNSVTFTCCPHCMRKHILIKCFTYNILATNIMWPVIILPWGIFQLIRSFTKGHSKEVIGIINEHIAKRQQEDEQMIY